MNLRKLVRLLLAGLFLMLIGCSEEIFEKHIHEEHGKSKHAISFAKFKQQTGITDFQILKSYNTSDANHREVKDDYLIDTMTVMFFAAPSGKDTYTFKIFPITKDLNPKEYYNLVYEKEGDHWYEHIFLNVEKENPQPGDPKLESSQMIYSSKQAHFSLTYMEACQVIEANFHCTNTGPCATQGYCDGCDMCVSVTVTYFPCSTGGSGTGTGGINVGDNGGGGPATGIYIPNPYNGEEDLNNPSFVFAMSVASFTRTLPANLKNVMNSRPWLYPKIVDFMRNNGGLTQENKDAVIFALSNFPLISNITNSNWTFNSIELLQFHAFDFLLQRPVQTSADTLAAISDSLANGTLLTASPLFKYPQNSSYSTLYPEFTFLVQEYVPTLKNDVPLLEIISQLTDVAIEDIQYDMTWGKGPEINIVQLGVNQNGYQYKGKFNPNDPDKIFVDIDLVQMLESLPEGEQRGLLRRLITFSVVLHELVHYEDWDDGEMINSIELGDYFEELYGNGYVLEFIVDANGNETGEIGWIKVN